MTVLPSLRRRAMRLSLFEAVTYALMVGAGEAYFVADAVRLGAPILVQALVVSLPLFLGGIGPVLALQWLKFQPRRRPIVVLCAALQAAILALLATGDGMGWSSPSTLVAGACAYQILAQAGSTAWSSWFGQIVPARVRGRYFARRVRWVQFGTCAALVAGGLGLHALEPAGAATTLAGGGIGFAWMFGAAALFRCASAVFLALSPEQASQTSTTASTVRAPEKLDDPVRRILLTNFFLQIAVHLASPYFGPFMLGVLRLSYRDYMLGSLAVVVVKILALPSWGRVLDTHQPRAVFILAIFLVALVPVPWLWTGGLLGVIVGQSISGFSWGAHEVSTLSSLLGASRPEQHPRVFATQSIANGVAQLTGSIAGGGLLLLFEGQFRVLFLASLLSRLAVAIAAPRLLRHVRLPDQGRRRLLLRVMGFTPSGGLVHRPIDVGEDLGHHPDS